jgi:hypothetical protein
MIVYPVSPLSTPRPGSTTRLDLFDDPEGKPVVVGIALIFPESDSAATVEYISGSSPTEDVEQ